MGRKCIYTDDYVSDKYREIVCILKEHGHPLYKEEIAEMLSLKPSAVGRIIKTERENFDFDNQNIRNYVMSSPQGYFVPSRGKEAMAFCFQYVRALRSLSRWVIPFDLYMKETYPEQYEECEEQLKEELYGLEDEDYDPWVIFKNLV